MTAHGAKGLQAPLVILADATLDPGDAPRRTLAWMPDGHDGDALPIVRPRSSERAGSPLDAVVEAADRKELEEHWRLFYVAATRAEERLVVAGALSARRKGEPPATSWYAATAAALDALGVAAGEGERVFTGIDPQPPVATGAVAETDDAAIALPAWARRPAPQEARPPRPLAPSSIGEDEVADPPPTPAMRAAAERGRLLHALFERLPAITPNARTAAAHRWLERSAGVTDADVRDEIARAACGIIADPRFAALFSPEALGEAPIAATVGGAVIAGTVDRLLVSDDRVQVVDFKTGRRAPASAAEIPVYHLRQMAAYVAALRVIFPGRTVEAGLLYTAGPTLFALTADDLAKGGFVAAEQSLPTSA
jgi:ATP-dependent helicase/nuclease subunit A